MLSNSHVARIHLEPGTYVIEQAAALSDICVSRKSLVIEGAPSPPPPPAPQSTSTAMQMQPQVFITAAAGQFVISCLVKLVNLRVRLADSASPIRVEAAGSLVLSRLARVEGTIDIRGQVNYEMPAPLGM